MRHFYKKFKVPHEVCRTGFRRLVVCNIRVERLPFGHEGIAPRRVRFEMRYAAPAVVISQLVQAWPVQDLCRFSAADYSYSDFLST